MSCSALWSEEGAYSTGRIAQTQEAVLHPGGLALTRYALELAQLTTGASVLDLGCGTGATTLFLHSLGYNPVGLDSLESAAKGKTKLVCGAAEQLPFDDHCFDAVLAECSLSVMKDQSRALRECFRVLHPGGRLILSDLYAREPEAIDQVRSLSGSCIAGILLRDELEDELKEIGFSVQLWEDHSVALREFVARFLMEHGSLASLWGCSGSPESAMEVWNAVRAVRAGYFLLIATSASTKGDCNEQ